MSHSPGPTKLSDDPSSDENPLEVTIEEETEKRNVGPPTLPLDAPEETQLAEGVTPAGLSIAQTQVSGPTEIPPSLEGTVVEEPERTRDFSPDLLSHDAGQTVDAPRNPESTVFVPPKGFSEGETVDSHADPQSTELDDGFGPSKPRPSKARSFGLKGGPNLPGYMIIEEIGRGGMGVVYKAWHIRLDRPVALKMVLAGVHASSEQLDRFQVEAQAVAQIQDPGIVQIYDVGEHDGLPYFSLEFVSGGSLDQKIGGRPQPPMEAAEMVRKLALAMHQAHIRKIIHRDLKPANVLLTPEGVPKITDFGLAKRMEDDSHVTRSGAIMGTPSYMAPEQAWGQTREIGPHSDQYALGAILYTMLVGRPPFQGATALETLELARSQEPVAPTRLQPKIPVDIETICLKCLQKAPAKRYADVMALADELGRFLARQPILARPIGPAERLVRLCRRNPKVAGLAATVAVLLMTITIGSIAYSFRLKTLNGKLTKANKAESDAKTLAQVEAIAATDARKKAEKAQTLEAVQRKKAEKALEDFHRLAAAALGHNKSFIDTQRTVSVLLNQRLRQFEGGNEVRAELIQTSMKNLQDYVEIMTGLSDILKDKQGELRTKRTLAGLNLSAGRLEEEYDRFEEASRYFKAVDKLAEELVASFPDEIEPLKVLAVSKGTLGGLQLDRIGDGKAALVLFERTLAIRRQILGRTPEDEEAKRGIATALGALARTYLKLGDPRNAREMIQKETEIRDQYSPAFRAILVLRRERAGLEEKLGDLSLDLLDRAGAREHYVRALELRRAIADEFHTEAEARRDVYLSIRKVATLDFFEHKTEDALQGYKTALAEFERRLGVEPNSLPIKQDVAITQYYVATAYLRLKDFKAAEEHYWACLKVREGLNADPRLKAAYIDLMIIMARVGQHEEASQAARKLCEKPPLDARVYYQAACGFALCSDDVKRLPGSSVNEALARQYADEALKALRQALDAGWRNLGDLQDDPDLDPIRDDPGFTAIFEEFRKAAAL